MEQDLIYQTIDRTLETCKPVFFLQSFYLFESSWLLLNLEIKLEILCGLYCAAFFGFH